MRTEKQLQGYIMKLCKARGILCQKMESKSSRGWPDLILIFGGKVLFVEVKSPAGTGVLSEWQVKMIAAIGLHGGDVLVIASVADADWLIGGCDVFLGVSNA
jgi:hypothetical protein